MKPLWTLYWSPEGRPVGNVRANTAQEAIRQVPQPYSKFFGVLYCRRNPKSNWRPKVGCTPAPTDETPMPPPWTDEDDKKLALLLDRKAKSEQVKRDALFHVVDRLKSFMSADELADELIGCATAIRAALKPYDKEAS